MNEEIIKSLRSQNEYWAEESEKLACDKVTLCIFLMATTLASIFGCSWVVSDLIGIIWQW